MVYDAETAESPQALMERQAREHLQDWVEDFLWYWANGTALNDSEAASLFISTLRHLIEVLEKTLSHPLTSPYELVNVFERHLNITNGPPRFD